MENIPEIKNIYEEIQKKLYYMIPEKWNSVYLYASITEKVYQVPIGEMYFYYFPKGILKKNPINVYEIPAKFNMDEQQYMKLVKNLYGSIEELRAIYKKYNKKLWTNLTISIENYRFIIRYNYENIEDDEYSNYDRHLIWRYKYLGIDINQYTKKDRKIINQYLLKNKDKKDNEEIYNEPIYKKSVHNIIDYNRLEFQNPLELKIMEDFEENRKIANNQILAKL